ncbi:hypothetical protein D3C77_779020 [compost metagenome]
MLGHVADLVPAMRFQALCQIGFATGDTGHRLHRIIQRPGDAAGNQRKQQAAEQNDNHANG